jgi:hypothetical protein
MLDNTKMPEVSFRKDAEKIPWKTFTGDLVVNFPAGVPMGLTRLPGAVN